MILLIDNYDSFSYNICRYVKKLGLKCEVRRNDKITIDEIKTLQPIAIIISPGPCKAENTGICIELVKQLGSNTAILGICLGHQVIAEAYGGRTVKSQKPTHGKSSIIKHDEMGIFKDIPNPFTAGLYHSLISDIEQSKDLTATAFTEIGEVMAIKHKTYPVFGVQFHPESILTPNGLEIISNFISHAKKHKS